MTTSPLRIERRGTGVYPYLFHAGPYFWPITPEIVEALKRHAKDPPSVFVARLLDVVGTTRYLRRQIETVVTHLDERDAQLRGLQEALAAL
ncbi:MAG: hypothetical protein HY207_10180 [Nitrospirae bacterium]|nr:hypothetical protein [Nitrospirota bacterium]